MLINEDFFDSEDLSREEMMKNANSAERVENNSFRYVASVHYDSADICDLNYFEKVVDKLATNIEHSVFSSEEINSERYIVFEFNHSFKSINESMQFLRIIFEALKRPLKGMWKFELVDRTPLSDDTEECQVSLKMIGQRWVCPAVITIQQDNTLLKDLYFLNVMLLGPRVTYFDICNYLMIPNNSNSEQEYAEIEISKNHMGKSKRSIAAKEKSIWSSIDKINEIIDTYLVEQASVVEYNQQEKTLNTKPINDSLETTLKTFRYGKKILFNRYFIVQYAWTYLFEENERHTMYVPIGQFPITPDESMIYYVRLDLGYNPVDRIFSILKISKYA